MFWITEDHFLFVGLFIWGNAGTQTFSVSRNWDGFALAESRTRKSGTVATLFYRSTCVECDRFTNCLFSGISKETGMKVNAQTCNQNEKYTLHRFPAL